MDLGFWAERGWSTIGGTSTRLLTHEAPVLREDRPQSLVSQASLLNPRDEGGSSGSDPVHPIQAWVIWDGLPR